MKGEKEFPEAQNEFRNKVARNLREHLETYFWTLFLALFLKYTYWKFFKIKQYFWKKSHSGAQNLF
jgi:hypothetical protein